MMPLRVAGIVWIGAAACASASKTATTGPARWSGDFRATGVSSSAVLTPGVSSQASVYGTVTLTPEANAPERTRVDLSVTVRSASEQQLGWAVLAGRCGSAPAPVAGPNEFPLIDVPTSGTGSVRAVLPFKLDPHATYHANVYNTSRNTNEGDVMMCANLQRSGGR